MKNILVIAFWFFINLSFGNPIVDTIKVTSIDEVLEFKSTEPTIHFFCLIDDEIQKEIFYFQKLDILLKKKEIQKINNLKINIILFRDPNKKTKKIGLRVAFPEKDTVLNDFVVYFQNFNKQSLIKTQNRNELSKVYKVEFISNSNLAVVKIAEVFCADILADNILQYKDFIAQLINPVYTEKEEIEFLKDSLKSYKNLIHDIYTKLNQQNDRIYKLENPKEKNANSSAPKNSDNKPIDKNAIIKENE